MTVASSPLLPRVQGAPQGGRRSRLLSFVHGCNAVMGVVAEPSACGLQPASPASSQPPLCAAQSALGLLLSFSQSRCKPSPCSQVQARDGMGPL